MKILFVNTFHSSGGAAMAAQRLKEALSPHCAITLLSQDPAHSATETPVSTTRFSFFKSKMRFIIERLYFLRFEKNKEIRFQFSPANIGIDITRRKEFIEADIIHLHWINQGFISIEGLQKIIHSGKPIVITLHDFWYFTGGCHYPGSCTAYINNCGNCPYLKNPSATDLSAQLHALKTNIFNGVKNVAIVACSDWLKNEALKSSILKNIDIHSIANALPLERLQPFIKEEMRIKYAIPVLKKIILFGSMNIQDPRKGFEYFKKALDHLKITHTAETVEIVVFGKIKNSVAEAFNNLPFKVNYLGKIPPNKVSEVYSIADVYVSPSLEDNLPNTVAEAMTCGIPVVAFNIGGLPEMIDHTLNGYLARKHDAEDLATGIDFVLSNTNPDQLQIEARKKAFEKYDPIKIAQQYLSLYKKVKGNS